MTKADIVNEIAKTTGIDKPAVLSVVEQFMTVVKDSLAHGENVYLRGFGSFIVKTRAEKTARNISKNTTLIIPAHNIPAFKPANSFQEEVAKIITMSASIRKATFDDIDLVAEIYNKIHELEEAGEVSIGWNSKVYPVRETALDALKADTLFVMTINDEVVASAIINQEQLSAYSSVEWSFPASDDKVGVLHTLVVDPSFGKQGLGKAFVSYFEKYCKENGYIVVRLDTQVKNTRPFNMYLNLGYKLAGIRNTPFQDLQYNVELAMFEKKL